MAGTRVNRARGHSALVAAGVCLALSACAVHPPLPESRIPVETAKRTFAVGFQQLSERYVEYLPAGILAFEGLRGLNAIDPDFTAQLDGGDVIVRVSGGAAHKYIAPDESNAEAWAGFVVDTLADVRRESPAIAAAPIERIYEAVFDGSLSLLDSYSRYSGADEALRNRERRSGFGGIGVLVQNTARGASVVRIMSDSPAVRAGLKKGDLITHVDSHPVGKLVDASDVGRGPIGSSVSLRVERSGGETLDLDIRRQRVVMPTVEISVRDAIIVARLTGFNRSTTRTLAARIGEEIQELDGAARGIVLDLRSNPGGLLSEAVRVADLFIPEGRILSTLGRNPASIHSYEAREDDVAAGLPVVVLVNGRSASASEIVAAALQDHDRAVVVGSSSYGKGTVQTIVTLPNDGELTVTWSRFVTPSGYILNGLGVRPSICTSAEEAGADQIIGHALSSGADLTTLFEAWRAHVGRSDFDRKTLRQGCPASDRVADVDDAVARSLIADYRLYQRILAFAPTVVAAKK